MLKSLILIISFIASLGATVHAELPVEESATTVTSSSKPETWLSKNQDKLKTGLMYASVYGAWCAMLISDKYRTVADILLFGACTALGGYVVIQGKEMFENYRSSKPMASQEPTEIGIGRKIFNVAKKGSLSFGLLFPAALGYVALTEDEESATPIIGCLIGFISSAVHLALLAGEKLYDWTQSRPKPVPAN